LLLDSGQFAGKQIVSKEYIKQATSPASWLRNDKGKTCTWYGYQFWMLDYKGIKINYARGILGQYIFIIPAKNAVVVRLGKQRSATRTADIPDDVFVYLDAAFDLLR
jgi:CubicO group peptidase (beta-lactamase class C family)